MSGLPPGVGLETQPYPRAGDGLGIRLGPVSEAGALPPEPVTPKPSAPLTDNFYTGTSYAIGAGKSFYANLTGLRLGFYGATPPSLTNSGTITVLAPPPRTGPTLPTVGIEVAPTEYFGTLRAAFTNEASGKLYVNSLTGDAYGVSGVSWLNIDNAGLIQVTANAGNQYGDGGNAWGVLTPSFKGEATGVVDVWAAKQAVGVVAYAFQNAGLIEAAGGTAIGVNNFSTFTNSGTITAVQSETGAGTVGSIGALIGGSTPVTLRNSGTIEADNVFYSDSGLGDPPSGAVPVAPTITVDNSGKLVGQVTLLTDGPETINNTGSIQGSIFFGDGPVNTFDGVGGTVDGVIYLGHRSNNVTLGNDGETVVASGGDDTIRGGAGNDFIEVGSGTDTLDGGGGSNTLSFAEADVGVSVDLATGVAKVGSDSDSIANFHTVIGSSDGDRMVAGANAVEFISGAGRSTLVGGAGDDILVAGAGGDVMTGGGGDNTFVYAAGDHQLVVTDFDAGGDQDVIYVYGYAKATTIAQQGANTLISFASGDSILLDNVNMSAVTSSNVVFEAGSFSEPSGPPPSPYDQAIDAQTLDLTYDYTLPAGATEVWTDQKYAIIDSGVIQSSALQGFVNFTNDGVVVAQSSSWLAGLYAAVGQEKNNAVFTNAAGATFSVTNHGGGDVPSGFGFIWSDIGDAIGYLNSEWGPNFENLGRFSVTADQGDAFGVVSYDPEQQIVNAGQFEVTASGIAYGLLLYNVDSFINDGVFEVSGGTQAYGVLFVRPDVCTLENVAVYRAVGPGVTGLIAGGATDVTNYGLMAGDIEPVNGMTAVSDVVNAGAFVGNITLPFGGEYDGFQGKLIGSIAGDSGGETIIGGYGRTVVTFNMASSAVTVTQSPDGSWQISGSFGADHVTGAAELQFTDKTMLLGTPILAPRDDFWGNGHSDYLIENSAGQVDVGQAIGAPAFTPLAILGSEWTFEGNGDFWGFDGEDFLIKNTEGSVVVANVAGALVTYTPLVGLGPEWSFHGVGDFLNVGADQFLIENTSGAVVAGQAIGRQVSFTQVAALGPEWKFVGSGDYLGEGHGQFLIENTAGAVVVGDVRNGAAVYTAVAGLGPEWKFVGSGNFLGDGKDDFLIENSAGAVFAGEVVNGQAHYTQLTGLGPEWKFVGAGDYLGEGHDQFLIENSAGVVVVGDWTGGAIHFSQVANLGPEWVFH